MRSLKNLGSGAWVMVSATVVLVVSTLVLASLVLAAPPQPPTGVLAPLVPPPTNMIVLTNLATVYTNVAVRTPTLDFPSVMLYGSGDVFKGSRLILAWTPNVSVDVAGYQLSYGTVTGTDTNVYRIPLNVTVVIFYSLGTNAPYWFYVQATNSFGDVSPRSAVIVATPTVR